MTVTKINTMQAEYFTFKTIYKTNSLINTCRELGVAYIAYSPLGHDWLVNNFQYKSPHDFAPDDFRRRSTLSSQDLMDNINFY